MDLSKLTFGLSPAAGKGAVPFKSDSEMFKAQQDPRYSASTPEGESYREGFQERLASTETARRQESERAATSRTAYLKTIQPFKDGQELTAAMADPRYRTSDSYRQEVMDRVAAAEIHRNAHAASVSPAVSPAAPPAGSSDDTAKAFRSDYERRQAYANPQYRSNPDYRAEVEAREAMTEDDLSNG